MLQHDSAELEELLCLHTCVDSPEVQSEAEAGDGVVGGEDEFGDWRSNHELVGEWEVRRVAVAVTRKERFVSHSLNYM